MFTNKGITFLLSLFVLITISFLFYDFVFILIIFSLLTIILVESVVYFRNISQISNLNVELDVDKISCNVDDEIELFIKVSNHSDYDIGPIVVRLNLPEYVVMNDNSFWLEKLNTESDFNISSRIKVLQMGLLKFNEIELVITDRFGIFQRTREFSFNKNVKILPTLQKSSILHRINIIESSKLFNKFRLFNPAGLEYRSIREYIRGDDYRLISWKSMAKSSKHEPMIKDFETEKSIYLNFILLNSDTIEEGDIGQRKLDYAVMSVLNLSYIAHQSGGTFNVLFNRNGHFNTVDGSPAYISQKLFDLRAEQKLNFNELNLIYSNNENVSSVSVVLVDVPFPKRIDDNLLKFLKFNCRDVIVLLLDTPSFFTIPNDNKDVNEYIDLLQKHELDHINQIRKTLVDNNIRVKISNRENIESNVLEAIEDFTKVEGIMK